MIMPRRRPKISRLDASHARLAASLFPTGTNVPVLSPPSIGTPTSSNGSPTHPLVPIRAHSPSLFSSPAPSSTPPATEPLESHSHPSVSGPSTSVETNSARPPSKRRRAKRSEEERIHYLRSDPYVAQFEPYRVLCASCDKWIRLRPNSTYCSIPWDAHRKSCLARKGCVILHPFVIIYPYSTPRGPSLPTYYSAKDAAPPFVVADPDARKYDGERVLCKVCNSWIFVGPLNQAAQAWSQHRALCRPASPSAPSAASRIPRLALTIRSIPNTCYLLVTRFHHPQRTATITTSARFGFSTPTSAITDSQGEGRFAKGRFAKSASVFLPSTNVCATTLRPTYICTRS